MDVPGGVYAHVAGVDIVKHSDGEYYVLEDNLRTPSGVSYMLENRKMMMRLFPELFANAVDPPGRPLPRPAAGDAARRGARAASTTRRSCCSRPGHFNSAYFEHAFLAQQMGIELVEGQDLFVQNDTVFMRTTQGPQRVDVIYRRIDDDFLDPLAFRPDSMLGVPGLLAAYRAGRRDARQRDRHRAWPTTSRCIPYVPEMIRFYLGEEPILQERARPTLLRKPDDLKYVLGEPRRAGGEGGAGLRRLRHAGGPDREPRRARALPPAHPRCARALHRAAHALALAACRPSAATRSRDRHVDLRPYVLSGAHGVDFVPGGLTRVALREGSLVVNSSQGGGVKDTWVVD